MDKIKRFQDIESWKKSRELVREIYTISREGEFSKDWGLKDQIRRAAVSIMSNISEGFCRQTDKEFIQFLYIARGSASEVQSQLYVAYDLSYINEETFNTLLDGTEVIANLIGGFIRYLKGESADPRHETHDSRHKTHDSARKKQGGDS
ncbi:four helix bundle protein [candidate division WOR-3 bacterium]|nr:four helix bundle protein [candidate division WOR-3 bacterium]